MLYCQRNCEGRNTCCKFARRSRRPVVVAQVLSLVRFFETSWTAAHEASLSHHLPGVCPSSCPLNRWCHPTISSSDAIFSFCLKSFPASRSFPVSWLFTSGGQSIGASASASVLPMNIQGRFPFGLTGLISLQSKGSLRVFSSTPVWKHQFFSTHPTLWSSS